MPTTDPDDSLSADFSGHDAYAAIRRPNFRRYWIGNVVSVLGLQMQSVTVIWEIYKRTGNPFDVGLVGLVQVIPVLSLALYAGHVADRTDRKRVITGALALSGLASLGLAVVSFYELHLAAMFFCLFLVGVARAFLQPAKSSFLPQLVPREIFSNAVTWGLGGFQLAAVAGPAIGGWTLAVFGHAYIVYLLQAAAALTFIILLARVDRYQASERHESATLKSLGEGIEFVWRNKVILGALALDMFAVLLGGATALLPVFAKDILEVGPVGYGWMASAPAIGAVLMSLAIMHRRPMAKAGQALLVAVAGFGGAIIVFGLSTSFALSFAALLMTGAFDCISVVVRHTLVQVLTPDRMRGRVSAISGMFISASNELGEFESGTLARFTSPVVAVVAGGIGTLVVVLTTALAVPELRKYGRLDGKDRDLAESAAALETESTAEIT
jgi:MFS family permease